MHLYKQIYTLTVLLLLLSENAAAQKDRANNSDMKEAGIFYTDIPSHPYDLIVSRPTLHSATISILTNTLLTGHIQYGVNSKWLDNKTDEFSCTAGITVFIPLKALQADKRYYYQFVYQQANNEHEGQSTLNFFHTARATSSDFSFTLQADSHLDENTDTSMYLKTLQNMVADSADFLIDLGDTWMSDKYKTDYHQSLKQYIAQRFYLGALCKSSSLFLTLGNHDGEFGLQQRKKNADNICNWSTATRKSYYANPIPDDFYSGNIEKEPIVDNPENYYAWEWGNALFIVLDPFRYTNGNKDPWDRTLGEQQYRWLKNTLEHSKAHFKFVFIHNLVGGIDIKGKGRGGAEAANYFEWGGTDTNSVNTFSKKRPNWEMPIHQLLVANKVNIVFHGHDHFFAKQEKDGIIYQLVPQPGSNRYGNVRTAEEYGYRTGTIFNTPGYLKIDVSHNKAIINYIQSSGDLKHKNKDIIYSYIIE